MSAALAHAPAIRPRPIFIEKLEGTAWRRLYPVKIEDGASCSAWLAGAGYDARRYRLAFAPPIIPETAAERRWIEQGARRLKAQGKLPSAASLMIAKLTRK